MKNKISFLITAAVIAALCRAPAYAAGKKTGAGIHLLFLL